MLLSPGTLLKCPVSNQTGLVQAKEGRDGE